MGALAMIHRREDESVEVATRPEEIYAILISFNLREPLPCSSARPEMLKNEYEAVACVSKEAAKIN